MRIGINGLALRRGPYSGVHVAVRGAVRAVAEALSPDDSLLLYTVRKAPTDLPEADGRLERASPRFPAGTRTGRILYEQFRLPSRVIKDRLDLLHCPVYVMPRLCPIPTVVSVHDVFALRHPEFCTRANARHFASVLPPTLERARRVIVPSEHVRKELHSWNELRDNPIPGLAGRIRTIPWGVDERFRPLQDRAAREAAALRYGLPPKYVLFVGRMEPKKNVQRAVEAYFAAVMSRNLPHRMVIAGPKGWGVEKRLRRVVDELALTDKVSFLGFVPDEDMPALYAMADALLFPSLDEGFGFPVLEAMACGTPVVCADVPALAEIGGDAALRVPPRELPAWREALESVLCDENRAAAMHARGLEIAAGYPWRRHGERTVALYREALSETRD